MDSHEDISTTNQYTSSVVDLQERKALEAVGIKRMGYLKKLKTTKIKLFVLRKFTGDNSAQLEYFDAKELDVDGQLRFIQGHAAKHVIPVAGCFAVNKKEDCKKKCAISVFTSKETFTIVANSEREQELWLKDLLELQRTSPVDGSPSENAPPLFDYVWNVDVQKKELGLTKGVSGPHRLCLRNRILMLYPFTTPSDGDAMTFSLARLRTVGHAEKYFYLEVGRQASTGPGKFVLAAEDVYSAQHMHDVISEEMRKGGTSDENASSSHTNGRTRSNTDSRPRPREGEGTRRNTDGSSRDRQAVVPENEMATRAGSDLTPGSGGSSKERLARSSEQRIPEYAIPDFQHTTSVEDNYLPVDLDPAYYPCDFQAKPVPLVDSQPNYSAIAKVAEVPRASAFPGLSAVQESPRTYFAPSIPEELGDYIPVTMPSHPRVTPTSSVSTNQSSSSEESSYFAMNLPPKVAETSKSPPPPASIPAVHDRLPPVPEMSPGSAYMMMAPAMSAIGAASDSRRSTMSNASYQSHPSDRDEHHDAIGSDVTYAVMEPVAPRGRRENTSRDASTSSLGSSFGWDRLSSTGSRTDYNKLEKVKAFMVTEDQDPKIRESRAYSTGCHPSKPSSTFKPELPVVSTFCEPYRTRAFSLGNHSSSPTGNRTTRPRGLIHSPSATMVLGGMPSTSRPLDVRGEIRLISASDAQLTPPDGSGRSTPSAEMRRGDGGNRAEDLMELTFRPRSGS